MLCDKRKILERKSALILMSGHVVTRCSTDVSSALFDAPLLIFFTFSSKTEHNPDCLC